MFNNDKSYYCGNGNDFFGNEYSKKLEKVYQSVENYIDFDYKIIYSLDKVNNVNIVPAATFKTQDYFKNDILLKKENLAQLWYQSENRLNGTNEISEYCFNKLSKLYPTQNRRFGNPIFEFTLYNKDCFIEKHKDGDDDDKGRLCVVILYLNKDWKKGMGGELIITDEYENNLEITPEFGNFAILDFQNFNLKHEVKKITDENFHRKALISFIHLAPIKKQNRMITKDSKILITGGSGLVGQNLTNRLHKEGYKNIKVNLHKRGVRKPIEGVEYTHFDLKTYEQCLEATKDVDVVYHCAASTSNAVDTVVDPLAHVTPNVAMNNFLIDASWRNKVQHYIFLSSNTVYPPKGDKPVVETDFLFDEPYPVYFPVGWMKRYAEVQCELYAKYLPVKMKCTVIRPANLFGPHDKYDFNKCHVTPATIRKVADKMDPIPVWGDGSELRDLLYIEDFVEALQIVMEKETEDYQVYNVGSNRVYSVLEVLEIMKRIANFNAPTEFIKGKPSMIPTRKIDSFKIFDNLGWQATTSLEDGLANAYEWYLENKSEFQD
jgi:GDP-L-fucose synthase